MEQTLQEEADAIANDPEIAELRQQETAKRAELQASNVPVSNSLYLEPPDKYRANTQYLYSSTRMRFLLVLARGCGN